MRQCWTFQLVKFEITEINFIRRLYRSNNHEPNFERNEILQFLAEKMFFRPLCEREADTILKLEMQEGQFPSSFGIYWKKKEISDITEDEQIELSRRW